MSEKRLLEIDGKKETGLEVRLGGGSRSSIEPLIGLLQFIDEIKSA